MSTVDTKAQGASGAIGIICCGRRLRSVSVDDSTLLFTYCGGCEKIRWFADGLPVERETAIELAGVLSRELAAAARPSASASR